MRQFAQQSESCPPRATEPVNGTVADVGEQPPLATTAALYDETVVAPTPVGWHPFKGTVATALD